MANEADRSTKQPEQNGFPSPGTDNSSANVVNRRVDW